MKFIADFHIHSHFSVATSKQLTPEHLDYWGRIKGIKVIGTGDFTHPGWVKELRQKIEPAEPGLFKLKKEYKLPTEYPTPPEREVRFLLTTEISNIYKQNARVRKVHNVIFAPDFESVKKIQKALKRIGGNITSDGRPILGLDSRDLLEMTLRANERNFFVPAHIWTPWFSALGSKSGFDSIEECYEDLTEHVFAVETGLSTDPPMHWTCRFLDNFTLISNSDAHSPEKVGRNANLFDTELSYDAITGALKTADPERFLGTIDLFPQEGKYHYDGHRKCGVAWDPLETLENNGICPVCGKKVTIGVMNRVAQLADREDLTERKNRLPFYSIIPLKEIISELEGVGPNSKRVDKIYHTIVKKAGSELDLLLNVPCNEIRKIADVAYCEAIRRMRNREVIIREGYDGEFGRITVFREGEKKLFEPEPSLFGDFIHVPKPKPRKLINFDLKEYQQRRQECLLKVAVAEQSPSYAVVSKITKGLNREQQKAVGHLEGPALILAGPGSGKTRTLTFRMANLIRGRGVPPEKILAVTFTNKAASEMKQRLKILLNDNLLSSRLPVFTFHGLGYAILKKHSEKVARHFPFSIVDSEDRRRLLLDELHCKQNSIKKISDFITQMKQHLEGANQEKVHQYYDAYLRYENMLREMNAFDLDDLLHRPVTLFETFPQVLTEYRKAFPWIMIDEYQDINQAQYELIRLLAPGGRCNLFAIGDPNQAIYGFRGANVHFIGRFRDDYPGAKVYQLKKSYRCTNRILRASGGIIQSPVSEETASLKGINRGVKINITEHRSDRSEAEFVARTIEKMIGGVRFFSIDSDITRGEEKGEIKSLSDFAVLVRISRQLKSLEKAMQDHGIPYQTIGDVPFFKKEPARTVIDCLKLTQNPQNLYLQNKIKRKNIILVQNPEEILALVKHRCLNDALLALKNRFFKSKEEKHKELFERLLDLASECGDNCEEFLKLAALGTGPDTYRSNLESVSLMTLHAAKGLEFDCVFIVGCEDGLLPYSLFRRRSDPEEERRLLYVGMTRAKKYLFLSHANRRLLHGKTRRLPRSPFLDDIEQELYESKKEIHKKRKKKPDPQMTLF